MTALHQQWIDAYDRVKDLPDDELVRTIYKTKIRNTLMKARQRRNQNRVRVILVARRGKSVKALTRRATRMTRTRFWFRRWRAFIRVLRIFVL